MKYRKFSSVSALMSILSIIPSTNCDREKEMTQTGLSFDKKFQDLRPFRRVDCHFAYDMTWFNKFPHNSRPERTTCFNVCLDRTKARQWTSCETRKCPPLHLDKAGRSWD
jgi:hypothetical protein